jgi:hypothetical protein
MFLTVRGDRMMLPAAVTIAVGVIYACTACFLLVETGRLILRSVYRKHDEGSKPQGPPDLFGGF